MKINELDFDDKAVNIITHNGRVYQLFNTYDGIESTELDLLNSPLAIVKCPITKKCAFMNNELKIFNTWYNELGKLYITSGYYGINGNTTYYFDNNGNELFSFNNTMGYESCFHACIGKLLVFIRGEANKGSLYSSSGEVVLIEEGIDVNLFRGKDFGIVDVTKLNTKKHALYEVKTKKYITDFIFDGFEGRFNKHGHCVFHIDGKYGIVDTYGKYVILPTYDNMHYQIGDNGFVAFYDKSMGKWGFIGVDGQVKIEPTHIKMPGKFTRERLKTIDGKPLFFAEVDTPHSPIDVKITTSENLY